MCTRSNAALGALHAHTIAACCTIAAQPAGDPELGPRGIPRYCVARDAIPSQPSDTVQGGRAPASPSSVRLSPSTSKKCTPPTPITWSTCHSIGTVYSVSTHAPACSHPYFLRVRPPRLIQELWAYPSARTDGRTTILQSPSRESRGLQWLAGGFRWLTFAADLPFVYACSRSTSARRCRALGLGKRRWATAASCVGAWAHKARRSGMQACRRRRMKRSERARPRHWAAASQLPAHWVGPKTPFGP
jgi:hypothetical protein